MTKDGATSLPYIALHHVVGVVHDVSRQTKVTDLGHSVVSQEDIASSHVSVNALESRTHVTTTRYILWACKSQVWPNHSHFCWPGSQGPEPPEGKTSASRQCPAASRRCPHIKILLVGRELYLPCGKLKTNTVHQQRAAVTWLLPDASTCVCWLGLISKYVLDDVLEIPLSLQGEETRTNKK